MDFQDWSAFFKFQKTRFGPFRGLLRTLRSDLRRDESRALLKKYIRKNHRGIEIGSGEQTIAPIRQTILSDAYPEHAGNLSLAREFFPAESVPYPDQSFDFLISEHVLEHLPDAIRGLNEWHRVLKSGGKLFLFLPHPERTFDQRRKITPLQHFFDDHAAQIDSSDETHWAEWQQEVIQVGLAQHYKNYTKAESLKNNLIHRHVFTPESTSELLKELGWQILEKIAVVRDRTDSFAIVATKIKS